VRVELTEPQAHACEVVLGDDEQIFVGRARDCEIRIPCKSVSKRHARLIRQDDQVVIEDLGSRNGLRVNGVVIRSAYLEPGDLVQVGRATLRLKAKDFVSSTEESGFRLVGDEPEGQPRLVLIDDLSSSWDLTESSTIGCRAENTICLKALGVSRFHAEVVQDGESWVINDLGATNGVQVNGETVDSAVLEPGDEITIGETRMRFELHRPASPGKRRLRAALAAAAAVLLCATGVAASSEPPPAAVEAMAQDDLVDAGMREVMAGRYEVAHDVLRSGEAQGDVATRRACRALRKLVRELERLEDDPEGFLWERGAEVLEGARELELSPAAREWLDAKRDYVRANRFASEALESALVRTEAATREPERQQALGAFMDVALTCSSIDPQAECFEAAQRASAQARQLGIARITSDLRGLEAQQPPSWTAMQDAARRGLEFTQDVEERLTFRQLIGRCQREQAAARVLAKAQELLAAGELVAGLSELERIGDTSYYAGAKQQLVQRVELDKLLKRAKQLYARGAGQQARDVLDEAFDLDRLELQLVQREVGALRQAWVAVEREFLRGERAAKSGRRVLARDAYEAVLRLEQDTTNRYHQQALERLAYVQAAIRDELQSDLADLDRTLALPLEELRPVELGEAAQRIQGILDHPAVGDVERSRVDGAIKLLATRVEARERVKAALFSNDVEAFELLNSQLSFLDRWLPTEASQREDLVWAQERLAKRMARLASTRRLAQASK